MAPPRASVASPLPGGGCPHPAPQTSRKNGERNEVVKDTGDTVGGKVSANQFFCKIRRFGENLPSIVRLGLAFFPVSRCQLGKATLVRGLLPYYWGIIIIIGLIPQVPSAEQDCEGGGCWDQKLGEKQIPFFHFQVQSSHISSSSKQPCTQFPFFPPPPTPSLKNTKNPGEITP